MQRGKALALTLLTPIDIEIEMKNTIRSELLMTLAVEVFSKVHPSSRPTEKNLGTGADRRQTCLENDYVTATNSFRSRR